MVVVHTESGEIELRLVESAAFDQNDYYDEYCPYDEQDIPQTIMPRYILAGHKRYGVEITLRKGFSHVDYDGAFIVVMMDMETGKNLLRKRLFQKEIKLKKPIISDRREELEMFDRDIFLNKQASSMSNFFGLRGSSSSVEFRDTGIDVDTLRGLRVTIIKLGKTRKDSHSSMHGDMTKSKAANQGLVVSAGMTPELSSGKEEKHVVDFIPRTSVYLKKHHIERTPIPLKRRSWSFLAYEDKKRCLRALQVEDQRRTLDHRISISGPVPDVGSIKEQMFKERRADWRGWVWLSAEERQTLYTDLQTRMRHFWEGAIPPEELFSNMNPHVPTNSTIAVKSPDLTVMTQEQSQVSTECPILAGTAREVVLILSDSEDEDIPLSQSRKSQALSKDCTQSPRRRRSMWSPPFKSPKRPLPVSESFEESPSKRSRQGLGFPNISNRNTPAPDQDVLLRPSLSQVDHLDMSNFSVMSPALQRHPTESTEESAWKRDKQNLGAVVDSNEVLPATRNMSPQLGHKSNELSHSRVDSVDPNERLAAARSELAASTQLMSLLRRRRERGAKIEELLKRPSDSLRRLREDDAVLEAQLAAVRRRHAALTDIATLLRENREREAKVPDLEDEQRTPDNDLRRLRNEDQDRTEEYETIQLQSAAATQITNLERERTRSRAKIAAVIEARKT